MATILLLALALSCVAKKHYVALESELTEEQAASMALQADLEATRAALAQEQSQSKSLQQALAEAEADVASLNTELEALKARNAKLLEEVKDKKKLQASIEEMQAALAELDRRKAQADARVAAYRDLLERFQKLIDAGKLKVKIVDGRMVVEMATDVLFASGSAKLSEAGKTAVTEVAAVLAELDDRRFQVEGHTDSVPIATSQFASNWELASARATTVVKAMVDAGVPPDRLSAASFGEFRPVAPNDTPENKAANRRIEIVVVPDLSDLPGFDELQGVE
mgnify:CR=1 FL=1